MKKFRWQIIIILVTGMVMGLLLLSEQTGFRLVSPVPASGGVYTEGLIGSMQRLNPVLDYYNSADRDVDRLIFSSLIKFDDKGLPKGDLAETWGVSYDGLTYNFQLRENAEWHDGTPVTADDVVFTVNLLRDPDSILPEDIKTIWNTVEVTALSDNLVQFTLPEAFSPFMDYLNFGILPQHLLGGMTYAEIINSQFNLNPVGSGPYRFEDLLVDNGQIQGVVLASNSNYYLDAPYINDFVFRYYNDAQSAYSAYEEGTVQGISHVTEDILQQVLDNPDLSLYSAIEPEFSIVLFNLSNSDVDFLQDENVRRALLMALDRRGMIDRILNGQGVIADVPVLPNNWAYYSSVAHVDQDVAAAENLLKEADYTLESEGASVRSKDGQALSFRMLHPNDDYHTQMAEVIQSDWAKIGVEVELVPVSYDSLILDHLQPLTYEAALIDINYTNSPDPDPYPFWDQAQQSGGQNYSQWENRIVSQYLEEGRVLLDTSERAKLYRNFQVVFAEELPALPLFYPVYNFAVDQSVQGIRMGSWYDTSDRFNNITGWYLLAQTSNE
ncbi:MAG: peptide/nickel transport system substrate-binding protein [Chloroflexota bacterium]|nr:peptide/nickel transport system substrate-binding protein [Chloroflexota bacterium]